MTEPIEARTAHRPWPLPERAWINEQSWRQQLFAHWPLDAARLRPLVPSELEIEEFDGTAWLGMTPFLLTGFRMRGLPPLPGVSEFPELNVRTYVRFGGRSGVYFFSLDAGSLAAVTGARALFGLPYHHAEMRIAERDGWITFESERKSDAAARFRARYRATGAVHEAEPGTLDHFLTERYALFVVRGGKVRRTDIHHAPWPLQSASAELEENGMTEPLGIELLAAAPLLHYSHRQDTVVWAPTEAGPAVAAREEQ